MWQLNGWIPYVGSPLVFADHQPDYSVNLLDVYRYYTIIDSILVSIEPARSSAKVTLFPNPAHSMVYVSARTASTDPHGSLTVYDPRGQLL
jgi:hypothetical protein